MATKVVSYGKNRLMHRVWTMAGKFAVADVLAFGSDKITFEELVDALGSDELPDETVVVAEYEYWDKDSLIKKLRELRAGYIAFAEAVLRKED